MTPADAASELAPDSTLPPVSMAQNIARVLLGSALIFAGISHLTFARQGFQAQVPRSLPLDPDFVVLASGVVEIGLGGVIAFLPRYRVPIGWGAAAFFAAVFPGNIAQYLNHASSLGLDTDRARGIRLLFQPLLMLWALWSTGAWPRRKQG
ncbi:DoxX family protein [Deinococcus sp. UYEF24]